MNLRPLRPERKGDASETPQIADRIDADDLRCPSGCPSEDDSATSTSVLNETNIPAQLTWEQLQEVSTIPNPVTEYLQLLSDTHGYPLAPTEFELAFLLTRWPNLPQHIRQTIMMLVRSVEVAHRDRRCF